MEISNTYINGRRCGTFTKEAEYVKYLMGDVVEEL
jgi:hypothetical protein